jgi:peptide/nickel transport system ATP-binding protein
VSNLRVSFVTRTTRLEAVRGVSFDIGENATLAVVGESGSGKTVSAMSILRLLPENAVVSPESRIEYGGQDLLRIDGARLRALRGREISAVFQEPMSSLNPVLTVGEQIAEVLRLHEGLSRQAALARTVEMLELVKIPNPQRRIRDYPHQFSGGMRQRVMIAMALSCNPKLLIADEPTTALDVTIQAQILELLAELKERLGMAVMLITHAMGVIAESAQRVVVMYAGKVVEEAPVEELFRAPRHPYTQGLIRSIPRVDMAAVAHTRLQAIPGVVPGLINPPEGCRFAPRCPHAKPECTAATPQLREVGERHRVACILA